MRDQERIVNVLLSRSVRALPLVVLGAAFVPAQIPWMLAVNLLGGVVLARTVFGFHVYATGGNPRAAHLCGVPTSWVKIRCFIWTAMGAALAGMISLAHLGSAAPLAGTGLELDVFAAVVIGGTRLSGGVGSVAGTFLGAAIMAVLRNGLVLMRVPAFWQEALSGAIIVAAVALDKLARWKEADER